MDYQQALEALGTSLKFGIDPSLEPITRMCQAMGNPQQAYDCIQIAGTNGKTSVTRMTAALVRGQGLKTGLYTSPELVNYPERIEIDGEVITNRNFADCINAALDAAKSCEIEATEFELLTAGALWLFAREGVQVAILECGLGGRWDATSVCTPKVAVITGIGLDHTKILGDTIEQIAAEKAAIIKPGCRAVLAPNLAGHDIFTEQASSASVPVSEVDPGLSALMRDMVSHMPAYQACNAAVAFQAAKELLGPISLEEARVALCGLQIPGRFETLRRKPLLLIDAAHNPQSAQVLAEEVEARFPARESRPTLLLGVLADKDVQGVVQALAPLFPKIVCTASDSPRAIDAQELARIVEESGAVVQSVIPAIEDALLFLDGEDVIATGSITVAGQVKKAFLTHVTGA